MVGHVFLGKYKAVRLLDEGGMSKIFLARQASPDREVVVKVLKETHLAQPKVREHFHREIYITSRFKHSFAVGFIDADAKAPEGPVLVLEYLRGVDLNQLLFRDKRFTPERVGRLLAQLCAVLQAAHDAGIVHRDIKPGNLMILFPGTPVEQVRLMDFGLARMSSLLYIAPDELFDFTLPPAAGTPEYICPEQVRGNEMDGRGDLYSVGVVLFEMLTGRRPFTAPTVEGLMQAHADHPPPTFAELGLADAVPPAVERLVRDCLAKHPDGRPASANELLRRYEIAVGKHFVLPRRTGVVPVLKNVPPPVAPSGPATPMPAKLKTTADHHAVEHHIEARMPESMAILKLKGFVQDLGGEVVDSVPGLIRVRLAEAKPEKRTGWFSRAPERRVTMEVAPSSTDIELHMTRPDPTQPSKLRITLIVRSANGIVTPEWKARSQKISRDLQAYLMGR